MVQSSCDGEEIFPPVNRPDVTPVITVSTVGGRGRLSFPSFPLVLNTLQAPCMFYFDFNISRNSASSSV